MELHAYTRTISDLFSVKRKYVVPRFQREYSWSKEQVKELWDDIVINIKHENGNYSHEEYFIGALVLVGDDKSSILQIVDGQQRLTTITILLSVLCDRFLELKKKAIAESIYDNYIAGKDDDGHYYFKLENETPKPFFQKSIQHIDKATIQPESIEERTLLAAYKEFYQQTSREACAETICKKKLSDDDYETYLKALRDQVVKYLKVIFITVTEEEEAYTIFETLNARGMNLSFVDLIKNKLFKELNGVHPDDDAKTTWKSIRSAISSRDGVGSLETFVRHWWISKYSYVSAENVYKSFKQLWAKGHIDAKSFIEELHRDAQLYVKISSPLAEDFKQKEDRYIYNTLSAFKVFGLAQQRPFLLSLLKARERGIVKKADLEETLTFLENFHFKFNAVCSQRPSGVEGSYSKAARDLQDAKDKRAAKATLKTLRERLQERVPDPTTFEDKFKELSFYKGYTKDKKVIQYILSKIEMYKQTNNELTPEDITLEHILPQANGEPSEIGLLGNLLPLAQKLNEEAADRAIDDKLAIYRRSNFAQVKEFVDIYAGNWNKQDVINRTIEMATLAYTEVWAIKVK